MIRMYETVTGEYDYEKIAKRLLTLDWKLAEHNKMNLFPEEVRRYKCVLKTLSELTEEELLALAIRYYKSDEIRSYGAIATIPYPKAAEIMGISKHKYMDLENRTVRKFGELAVKNWEGEVKEFELKQ